MQHHHSFETFQTDRPTAVAIGFFDGIHLGHQEVIRQVAEAKKQGLAACVFSYTIDTDSPMNKTGIHYLRTQSLKEKILREMGVDYFIEPSFSEFCKFTPEEFAGRILHDRFHAKLISCGTDLRFGYRASGNIDTLRMLGERYDFTVEAVEPVTVNGIPISSTNIRAMIEAGEVEQANQLLTQPFALDTVVVKGNQIGRTIDFPTINQLIPPAFAIPKFGVYAALALVGDQIYPAVSNVGVKPTVGSTYPLCETYLEGFSGDLYGKTVEVQLLKFIRLERKFSCIEELKKQILKDTEKSMEYLDQQGK